MRPISLVVSVLLFVVSLLHLLRVVCQVDVTVDGAVVPMWTSVVGCIVAGLLAALLWRESRKQ